MQIYGIHGFSGGKERIRVPINSKNSSLEALKRHIIEIVGLKAEFEKRGLGSSIELKLCRLEKSAEGSKTYAINNDDNEDEMTFLFYEQLLLVAEAFRLSQP